MQSLFGNSFSLPDVLKVVGKRGLASTVVAYANIHTQVPMLTSNDKITRAIQNGVAITASEKIIDYFDGKDPELMNYTKLADDIVFNSLGSLAISNLKLDQKLGSKIYEMSPLNDIGNDILLSGVLMTALSASKDFIENTPSLINGPLNYIVKPITNMMT